MSELNTNVLMTVQAGPVANTPIDDTLSIAGEAADAKAVGDALANKVDTTGVMEHVTITFDGIQSDNSGVILAYGDDIPIDDSAGADSIKETIEAVSAKTGADIAVSGTDSTKISEKFFGDQIPVSSSDNTPISTKLGALGGKTGADIPISGTDSTTVKATTDAISGRVTAIEGAYLKKGAQELTSSEKAQIRTNLSLGGASTQDVLNTLTAAEQGYVLDARQGAVLSNLVTSLQSQVTALQNQFKKVNLSGQVTVDNLDSGNNATAQSIDCWQFGCLCHLEVKLKFTTAMSANGLAWKGELHGIPMPCGSERGVCCTATNSFMTFSMNSEGLLNIRFSYNGTNTNTTSIYTCVVEYIVWNSETEPEEEENT